jgi:hypothetical protein
MRRIEFSGETFVIEVAAEFIYKRVASLYQRSRNKHVDIQSRLISMHANIRCRLINIHAVVHQNLLIKSARERQEYESTRVGNVSIAYSTHRLL